MANGTEEDDDDDDDRGRGSCSMLAVAKELVARSEGAKRGNACVVATGVQPSVVHGRPTHVLDVDLNAVVILVATDFEHLQQHVDKSNLTLSHGPDMH